MTPIKTRTHLFHAARLLAALLLLSGIATASSFITATGVDSTRGMSITMKEDGADVNAYFVGVIFVSVLDNGVTYGRDSLCVDLFTNILVGQQYTTQVLSPNQVPGRNLNRVSWLVDNALLPAQSPGSIVSALDPANWITTAAQGAGAQLAIWDIVHDNGDGFSAGRVRSAASTDSAVLAWASLYESLSAGNSDDKAFIYVNKDSSSGVAAQMLAGPQFTDGGPKPDDSTPEPAAFILVGAGLIAGAFVSRRLPRRG